MRVAKYERGDKVKVIKDDSATNSKLVGKTGLVMYVENKYEAVVYQVYFKPGVMQWFTDSDLQPVETISKKNIVTIVLLALAIILILLAVFRFLGDFYNLPCRDYAQNYQFSYAPARCMGER